jgi:predicted nucleotidyltransferase
MPLVNNRKTGKINKSEKSSSATEPKDRRPVDILFGSGARVDVLWCLLKNPDTGLTLSEIIRLTGRDIKDVKRVLDSLATEEIGLAVRNLTYGMNSIYPKVRNDQDANDLYKKRSTTRYFLKKDHPWIPNLMGLMELTVGPLYVVREELSKLAKIDVAFVFGSYAKSKQVDTSDIDLIIIGSYRLMDIIKDISRIEDRIHRPIDVKVLSPEEWKKLIDSKHYFYVSLLTEPKIFMVGTNGKLEEITFFGKGED